MKKSITLSAEEALIEQARWQAANERTTLNQLFREWLARYVAQADAPERYDALMANFEHIQAGGTFSREEMNERR